MPEDTPPRFVHATIESTSTRKRSEESSRKFVTISFPVSENADLINFIEVNLRANPLAVTFAEGPQARLKEVTDQEEVNAHVDGQPARIRRSRVSNPTKERLQALEEASKTKHLFETSNEDEFCAKCGKATEHSVHAVPTFMECYRAHLATVDTPAFEHPGNAIDAATDDVGNFMCQPMSDEDIAFARYVEEHGEEPEQPEVSEAAQSLIEESRRTPANPQEAQEQQEAEAALVGHNR